MTIQSLHLALAWPEIFIASMACFILLIGAFLDRNRYGHAIGYWLSILSLLATAGWLGWQAGPFEAVRAQAFNGLYVHDPLADLLKIAMCVLAAVVFIYGRRYNWARAMFKYEYYVLGLLSVTGMMVMASARHLLTLYLGLELMSLCLYAMIAFFRTHPLAVEAAIKYFVLGALASSILLYGMSLLYGVTGSLVLPEISLALATTSSDNLAVILAVVFIVVALAFKLGVAPFHMWVPDVYHGAPTSTTAFIGTAPKLAAFAMLARLLIEGLEELQAMWQQMLIILALLSVAVGNLIAIAQDNLKRMLAYATVSHMGFFLFGILSGSASGYSAALFYALTYTTMSCAAFGFILYLATDNHEADALQDLRGLNQRSPWCAFLILILMFSMAGVPPSAGFFAKFLVIQALIEAQLIWVAVAAVLLAAIGAYYYLRIIKLVYFDAPDTTAALNANNDGKWLLVLNILLLIAVLPWLGRIIALCNQVIRPLVS